ncbi:hypothetical protein CerSpe_272120 [Prunus speciosa]
MTRFLQQHLLVPTALGLFLAKFTKLFSAPTGLPLFRPIGHQIPLNPGTPPVNVRPYKYPHFQKSEIETIVCEMLAAGLVQPSCSAYSSPVLLVKKKLRIVFQSQLLTSSLMNYMEQLSSLNWT